MSAFFLRTDFSEPKQPFSPRLSPRLRLFAAGQPQQTRAAITKIDIIA
jgi:hypothetical protein